MTGFATQEFTVRATSGMADLAAALDGLDEDLTVTLNARGGLDYSDALGRSVTFSDTTNTGFAAGANTGHLSLASVDGSSDITIGGDTALFNTVAPSTNDLATDVGQRVSGANALGLNYGTFSYSGATTVKTGQIEETLLANTDTLTINGVKLGATTADITVASNISASDIAAVFNEVSNESGVTAVAKNEVVFQMNMANDTDTDADSIGTLQINGITTSLTSNMTLAALVASLNNDHLGFDTGLVFSASGTELTIKSDSGATINVTDSAVTNMFVDVRHNDGDATDAEGSITTPLASEVYRFRGFLELTNNSGDVVLGTTATNDDAYTTAETLAATLGLELSKKSDVVSGGTGLDLSTATGASAAIASIDSALAAVNTIRGNLGAMSNRLEHTVSNLTTTIENHSASRSRIVDADFATESAALAKAQVLAQASTAMLAQANAAPQLALQLLQ
jgi:flagellin